MDHNNPFEEDSTFDDVNLMGDGSNDVFMDPSIQSHLQKTESELEYEEQVVGVDMESEENMRNVQAQDMHQLSGEISPLRQEKPIESRNNDNLNQDVQNLGFFWCISPAFYSKFFNVDTEDVQQRIKCVVTPWKPIFFEISENNADIYGPFWISTTLVFLIAATYNFTSWRNQGAEEIAWQQDFKILSSAVFFVAGFVIAMPFVAWVCFQYLGVSAMSKNISFIELACVYGYSVVTFCFSCILCAIVNNSLFEWITVLVAFAFSASFLIHNIWVRLGVSTENGTYMPPMGDDIEGNDVGDSNASLVTQKPDKVKAGILFLGLVGLHFIFACVLKIEFFA